jgi:3-deoxy-D-manno-octulosonate 8-phosphate phosphatase (KDO 8-P phosphatase)
MAQLGIELFYKGCVNKRQAFLNLKQTYGLKNEEIAYVGDDLPDLEIIKEVGLGIAVNNAVPLVKEFSYWVTEKNGGQGAVREVCDLILNAQGKMDLALKNYYLS